MTRNEPDRDAERTGSDEQRRTDRRATHRGDAANGLSDASRRRFLQATAGAGAALGGFGLASGAAADQDDGDGGSRAQGQPTPWLDRDGNLLRDPTGQKVILRGVNTADPKRLNVTAPARGKDAEDVIDLATDEDRGWHARVIRLPVQPVDIGEHPPGQGPPPVAFSREELETYLDEHLDSAVQACKRNGAYAIIDYHRHRDVEWTNEDLAEEVQLFWDVVAERYGGRPHVLFELYNEPQEPGMWGPIDNPDVQDVWNQWRETAQPWVDTIREHAPRNLVLIGSPSWTQSPEGALIEEFEGENLAYTYHIYPGHGVSENEAWDEDASWENGGEPTNQVYEEVPLFVTEFGWEEGAGDIIGGTTSEFGEPFRDWLESGPIHWTAWNFDPLWAPVMWERDFETGDIGNPYEEEVPEFCEDVGSEEECPWTLLGGDSYQGEFVKDFLADRANDDVPIHGDAPGQSGERGRGRDDAPGQNDEQGRGRDDAPGQNDERGQGRDGAPGQNDGRGQGRDGAPGQSDDATPAGNGSAANGNGAAQSNASGDADCPPGSDD